MDLDVILLSKISKTHNNMYIKLYNLRNKSSLPFCHRLLGITLELPSPRHALSVPSGNPFPRASFYSIHPKKACWASAPPSGKLRTTSTFCLRHDPSIYHVFLPHGFSFSFGSTQECIAQTKTWTLIWPDLIYCISGEN